MGEFQVELLAGLVEPPSFNLSNELMIRKHVHATVISKLFQLEREGSGLSESDRAEVSQALETALPRMINVYLFDEDGVVRTSPIDISILHTVVTKHQAILDGAVSDAFAQGWPEADAAAA